MGKKCVRLAMAGAALGMLMLSGAQSSQAQTAQPGASVTSIYTDLAEGAAMNASGLRRQRNRSRKLLQL